MGFTLTTEHLKSFLDPASQGNWLPFLDAVDPEVEWVIGDSTYNPTWNTGIYNVISWKERVNKRLLDKLQNRDLKMAVDDIEVVGLKAIVEASGSAVQNNGKGYCNRYCWILIFDEVTGKVVRIREYLNTALVREVMLGNEV